MKSDAQQLSGMVNFLAELSESIGGRVKRLDTSKQKALQCLQRVDDLLDLRLCTDGVQSALQSEDYEQAAGHIRRFIAMDQHVLRITAAAVAGKRFAFMNII